MEEYKRVIDQLVSKFVFYHGYKEATELVLQGVGIVYDTVQVLRDVEAATVVVKYAGVRKRVRKGLLEYHLEFSTRDRKMYDTLGLDHFFTKDVVQGLVAES